MQCRKCRAAIPDDSRFCLRCGANQTLSHKPKSRGNGQGTVFQRPNKSWCAMRTFGYVTGPDGVTRRKTVSKSGFKTKRDAVEYLPQLTLRTERKKRITLSALYDAWEPTHQVSKSTKDCYAAAHKWFRPLWTMQFADIDIDDLQECLDECPKGKRTKENMKALCGLLYKYAIPRHYATINLGEYLVIRAEQATEKLALPVSDLAKIRAKAGEIPYADYVVAQCYLGFRPSELLALDVKNYDRTQKAFTGGAKTDAGKDRIVTVSPKIQPIIDRLTAGKTTGPVFCAADGAAMSIKDYRKAFYDVLEAAGIENPIEGTGDDRRHKYTPHSCRHTFATLMKGVDAPDKDKLRLIGHTSTEMLRHYQDVDIDSLRAITDKI